VRLKRGVRFSPPVSREVTSTDAKYAIERGFFGSANDGYAGVYFGSLRGAKGSLSRETGFPGITTPDDHAIVFRPHAPTRVEPLRRRRPR
jgi:peptide/nickel transport system substrate-binding protein